MIRIKNLTEVLLKTKIEEDRCTNTFLWLLKSIPIEYISELLKMAGFISRDYKSIYSVKPQYPLPLNISRPDGLVEIDDKYIIIETKIVKNGFDADQFARHIKGSSEEFGIENCLFLFLSNDDKETSLLKKFKDNYPNKIGFLSWDKIVNFLKTKLDNEKTVTNWVIFEFIELVKINNLSRRSDMTEKDLQQFFDSFVLVDSLRKDIKSKMYEGLSKLCEEIIIKSNQKVEFLNDDESEDLPVPWRALTILGWHTKWSSYVYYNCATREIGVCLSGYQQDPKDRKIFMLEWENRLKSLFAKDNNAFAFTYSEPDDDDDGLGIAAGYFRAIETTQGQVFSPDKVPVFDNNFYIGYKMKTDPINIMQCKKEISDFLVNCYNKILSTYLNEKRK